MNKFWCGYIKSKYREKAKLCQIICKFIVYIKTENIYSDISKDVKTRFDTSNYELHGPLPKGKKQKSNQINETLIRWENNNKICCIKTKKCTAIQ